MWCDVILAQIGVIVTSVTSPVGAGPAGRGHGRQKLPSVRKGREVVHKLRQSTGGSRGGKRGKNLILRGKNTFLPPPPKLTTFNMVGIGKRQIGWGKNVFLPPPQTIFLDPPLRQNHAAVDLTTRLAGCFCPRSACALAFGVVHHFSIVVSCINVIARPVPVSCRVVRVGPVTCPQVAARASSARHWQIDVSRISIRTIIIVAFGVQRQYWR